MLVLLLILQAPIYKQIKICAIYLDILPRAEADVPDKSSEGLGSMSRYFVQILIHFIAYISHCLKSSVCEVVAFQLCNEPVVFHWDCYQNEAPAKETEISQHPLLGGQALRFCRDDHIGWTVMELVKFTDRMVKIHNHVKITNPGIKWTESLIISLSTFTYCISFQFLMPAAWVQQGHSRMVDAMKLKLKFQNKLELTFWTLHFIMEWLL